MSKHISVIADELVQKNHELKRENAELKQEVKDLKAALKQTQKCSYADECDDDDSCGLVLTRLLGRGGAR